MYTHKHIDMVGLAIVSVHIFSMSGGPQIFLPWSVQGFHLRGDRGGHSI